MRQLLFLALAALGVGCNSNRSEPAAPAGPPEVGSVAPDFALVGSDGNTHRLSELRGKPVVLAWYRKAFTGG
jgi:cytochrome oxidase Cu insertion factor (SCO1/SenC/PrrC family)